MSVSPPDCSDMLHPSDVLCNGNSIDHVPARRVSPVDDCDFVWSARLQLTASSTQGKDPQPANRLTLPPYAAVSVQQQPFHEVSVQQQD